MKSTNWPIYDIMDYQHNIVLAAISDIDLTSVYFVIAQSNLHEIPQNRNHKDVECKLTCLEQLFCFLWFRCVPVIFQDARLLSGVVNAAVKWQGAQLSRQHAVSSQWALGLTGNYWFLELLEDLLVENQGPLILLIENQGPLILLIENQGPLILLIENQGPPILLIENQGLLILIENQGPLILLIENQGPLILLIKNQGPLIILIENQGPLILLVENQGALILFFFKNQGALILLVKNQGPLILPS